MNPGTYTSIGAPTTSLVIPKLEVAAADNADVCEELAGLSFANSHHLNALNDTLTKLCTLLDDILKAQFDQQAPVVNVTSAVPEILIQGSPVDVQVAAPSVTVESTKVHVEPPGPVIATWAIVTFLLLVSGHLGLAIWPLVAP